ncbi:MAG: radical SAM protein [Candidatus Pacearchaeota archaeon]|nr:radical SAM protein [Candidatus Pacearchaeota archaeon]
MKILLVYPNIVESPKDISHGLAIISAVLKKEKHQVKLIDTSFGLSDSQILKSAKSFSPDLIAFTTATNDFEYACHIAKIFKKNFKVPIIAGGFHPTIAPEEAINQECFDIVCIGEGELTISELVSSLKKGKISTKIKNLWFKIKEKGKTRIIKNPIRPLIQDLDSLPFADRNLFDYKKYLDWNHGTASFVSTRGCPFKCSYCINHFLAKMYCDKGKYVRFRSINNLLREITQVIKDFPQIKLIEFYDDTFTLDEARIKQFCSRYKKEIGLPFNINARVNAVNPEMFKLLKQAGCVRVSIGIESGDEFIRNKILKRNMSDKQIIEVFKEAREAGLKTYAFNMIGIPFETKFSIKKTIDLNRKCQPDYVGVSIFNAFKGTEIYELCLKKNWLRKNYSSSYFRDSNIKHPNFSISQLRRIRNSFGFRVFIGYNPIRAIVDLIDKNLSQFNLYIFIRSKLIEKLRLLK